MRRYNWAPHLGMRGIMRMSMFKDVFVVSGCGVGGGSLGYANTLYRAASGLLREPAVGRAGRLGGRACSRSTTRPSGCSASSSYDRDGVADLLLREYAESIGVGDTYSRTPVGVFLGEPGETVAGPVLRRRGPGPHRLPALRHLHDRLPLRRQEHAGEELPVVRRAARGRDPARAHRDRHPPARRRHRRGRLRGHARTRWRRASPPASKPCARAGWSSRRVRSEPTACCSAAS